MKTIYIGKSTDNDIIIDDTFVSRKHLRISKQNNGEYLLEDLGSTNGTFVNGNRVKSKILASNDIVKIGETLLPWQSYFKADSSAILPTETALGSIRIGRSSKNDFVISNPSVSQEHAILEIYPKQKFFLTDLGSTNGTFLKDKKMEKAWVQAEDEIRFGSEKILISSILQVFQTSQNTQNIDGQLASTSKGQASLAPSKYEKKASLRKSIPFEGIALFLLLALATYGAIIYFNKNNDVKPYSEQEKKQDEKETEDYLKDYDDEGKKVGEDDKKIEKPNAGSLEDIIENAENAIFRVDALQGGVSQGFGTGFFVKKMGIGVSNYHVFSPGKNWQIKLKNGEVYEVKRIIEENSTLDYVIFETNAQNIAYLPIASQLPRKGQDIFVIGNPQGFELSVTKGIVSGIRNYNTFQGVASEGDNYIQIDAPISSGNSGGPVFNMNGEVVGIATMVINGKSGVAQNLNLAVNIQKLNIP